MTLVRTSGAHETEAAGSLIYSQGLKGLGAVALRRPVFFSIFVGNTALSIQ